MLRGQVLSSSGGGILIKGSSQQRGLRRQSVLPRLRSRKRLDFPVPKFGRRLAPCQSTHELTVLKVHDPHVTSLRGERFDLWETGWSKFVQIYLTEPRGCGLRARRVEELRQYLIGDHFALSLLQDVSLSGPWLERDCFLMRADFSKVRHFSRLVSVASNCTELVTSPATSKQGGKYGSQISNRGLPTSGDKHTRGPAG